MSTSLFRRVPLSLMGTLCLVVGVLALGPAGMASADPPDQAQNDERGKSGSRNEGGDRGGRSEQSPPPHAEKEGRGGSGSASPGPRDRADDSRRAEDGGQPGSSSGGAGAQGNRGEGQGRQPCPPASGNPGGSQPCGPPPCPPASPNAGGTQPCGHGPEREGDLDGDGLRDGTVGAAGSRAAWSGEVAASIVRAATGGGVNAAVELEEASVLGVSAQSAVPSGDAVVLEDLELAREGSSRAGGGSLLAFTGMTLLGLIAAALALLGLGRLARNAEDTRQE